jgi:hypothetical protein
LRVCLDGFLCGVRKVQNSSQILHFLKTQYANNDDDERLLFLFFDDQEAFLVSVVHRLSRCRYRQKLREEKFFEGQRGATAEIRNVCRCIIIFIIIIFTGAHGRPGRFALRRGDAVRRGPERFDRAFLFILFIIFALLEEETYSHGFALK